MSFLSSFIILPINDKDAVIVMIFYKMMTIEMPSQLSLILLGMLILMKRKLIPMQPNLLEIHNTPRHIHFRKMRHDHLAI